MVLIGWVLTLSDADLPEDNSPRGWITYPVRRAESMLRISRSPWRMC